MVAVDGELDLGRVIRDETRGVYGVGR